MLSRIAFASRQGLRTARLSSPINRARPVAVPTVSPWIRSYANDGKDGAKPPSPEEINKSTSEPANPSPSQAAASDAAKETPETPESKPSEESIPFHKLPDLTQGIPSTFEAEMEKASGKSRDQGQSALEAVDQEEYERNRSGNKEYISTTERNRKWWTRFSLAVIGASGTMGILYLGRNWDDQAEADKHPEAPNGWGPVLWWQRVQARFVESKSYYQDPAFDKLLPDPEPSFARPYTLVISLEDMLIHSEWSREHGWRVAKRPGMDYFIRYLSQYYEIVLWTAIPFAMAEPVFRKIDPYHFVTWPLWREGTKFEDGEIVKDLSYLNRDLSKVIVIDSNSKYVRKHPENAIILDPWKGNATDKELVSLIPFLEYIPTVEYSDVRKVLNSFGDKHIPTEFARREAIARKEFNARMEKERKHAVPSGMGALGKMLGLNPSNMSMTQMPEGEQNPSEAFAQGKMLQDIARERGQRYYEFVEKQVREHGDEWLKEEKEMMDKMQKDAMDNMFGSFGGMLVPKSEEEKKK